MTRATVLILVALVTACKKAGEKPPTEGTDSGNPTQLTITGDFTSRRTSVANIAEAWIGLDDVGLLPCDESDENKDFVGPYALDLSLENELGELLLGDDVCGAAMDLDDDSDQNTLLGGASIILHGETATGTPFRITSELDEVLEVESGAIDPEENSRLLLTFHVLQWTAGLDIDDGEQTNGVVLIDDEHNT